MLMVNSPRKSSLCGKILFCNMFQRAVLSVLCQISVQQSVNVKFKTCFGPDVLKRHLAVQASEQTDAHQSSLNVKSWSTKSVLGIL